MRAGKGKKSSTPKKRVIQRSKPQKEAPKKLSCPKCDHGEVIRNGFAMGEQRWKCKSCLYQFTRTQARGRPVWQKSLTVFLYSYGLSIRGIAEILQVQPSTVFKWLKTHAGYPIPAAQEGKVSIMGINDVQRQLKSASKHNSDILCFAINDIAFRQKLGITITKP